MEEKLNLTEREIKDIGWERYSSGRKHAGILFIVTMAPAFIILAIALIVNQKTW